MDVLEIIKEKRKEANLTQDDMAKRLNMPRTTYHNIESNVVNMNFNNTAPTKKRFCEICGQPSGFYPLCKYHKTLKEKGVVYKDENGNWIER